MLIILAFINQREIGRVQIHNTGIVNSKGEYKYEAWTDGNKIAGFCHKREDGWMKLTEKVLRKLRKVKASSRKNNT